MKFSIKSLTSVFVDTDARLHGFIASSAIPGPEPRKVEMFETPLNQPISFAGELELPAKVRWASLVLELYLKLPNFEGTPGWSFQGSVCVDLHDASPDRKKYQFVPVTIMKAARDGAQHAVTGCFVEVELGEIERVIVMESPRALTPSELTAKHLWYREQYMLPLQGLSSEHESTRVSDYYMNGRLLPSWSFWMQLERAQVASSTIETWAEMARLMLPGTPPSSLNGIKHNSQQHDDFLCLILGVPVCSAQYSDDVIAVPSHWPGTEKRGKFSVLPVDSYNNFASVCCGDCEDRMLGLFTILDALKGYCGDDNALAGLLRRLIEYRAFATLLTMNEPTDKWAHWVMTLIPIDCFKDGSCKPAETLVVDTIYPSVDRRADSSQDKVEVMKSKYHGGGSPSVALRPTFVFTEKLVSSLHVMRLFESNGHTLIPVTQTTYGMPFSDMLSKTFRFKETGPSKKAEELMNSQSWRHPPLPLKPLTAPRVAASNLINGIAVYASPASEKDKVEQALKKNGKCVAVGAWKCDSEKDDHGVYLFRFSESV